MNKIKPFKSIIKTIKINSQGNNTEEFRYSITSTFLYIIYLVIHFCFVYLFCFLKVYPLAIFNIISIITFSLSIYLNLKRKYAIAFSLASAEVLIHAFLVSYYLGDIGVRHAVVYLLLVLFMFPISMRVKIILGSFFIFNYCLLNYMDHVFPPVYQVPSVVFMALNASVAAIVAAVVCILIHYLNMQVTLAEEGLTIKNKALSESDQYNAQLLRSLSHDLANSLNLIGSAVSVIKKNPSKTSTHLDMITRANNNIISMVGHLREQQAIISGKKKLVLVPVNLKTLCEEAVWLLAEAAKAKEIEIIIQAESKSFLVWAEPISCLNGVVCNFLSNAIKFSKQGSKIQLNLDQVGNWKVLTIQDRGVGISEAALLEIFLIKKVTSSPGTEGEKGTGFGMPLAKAYLESYGGQIEIESKTLADHPSNHGTTFTLRFHCVPNS